jgi:ribosomal protein S18 acetylase RimI-like enzyme
MSTTYYGSGQASEVRQRLVDFYAEVGAAKAATEPFFPIPRFTERLDGRMGHSGWGCVVGEIGRGSSWRGAGVARTVHGVLMDGRPEARASLFVERENTRARALYERWG